MGHASSRIRLEGCYPILPSLVPFRCKFTGPRHRQGVLLKTPALPQAHFLYSGSSRKVKEPWQWVLAVRAGSEGAHHTKRPPHPLGEDRRGLKIESQLTQGQRVSVPFQVAEHLKVLVFYMEVSLPFTPPSFHLPISPSLHLSILLFTIPPSSHCFILLFLYLLIPHLLIPPTFHPSFHHPTIQPSLHRSTPLSLHLSILMSTHSSI